MDQIENNEVNTPIEDKPVENANTDGSTESKNTPADETNEIDGVDYTKGVKKRIDKLTTKLSSKDQEIAELRRQMDELVSKQTNSRNVAPVDNKPKLEDFSTIEEYTDALTDYKLNKKSAEESIKQQEAAKFGTYNKRVEAFKAEAPDFAIAVSEINDALVSNPQTVDFILESEFGPQIAYFLANHDDALEKLQGMSNVRKIAYLSKLENDFELKSKKSTSEPKESKKTISRVTGNNSSGVTTNVDSYAAWKAARLKAKK